MTPSKKTTHAAPSSYLHSFRVPKDRNSERQRAKYNSERRKEVKAVRHRRACLRCSLLKIKCSDDDLCTTCQRLSLLVHAHDKQTLSFSGCIRTRLSEVSVFEQYLPPQDIRHIIEEKGNMLALSTISLSFESDVTWNLETLANDIVKWLNNHRISHTSKVGTLSSPKFVELVKSSAGKPVAAKFQRMLYAISLAYTQPTEHELTISEIHGMGCIAGHEFLDVLDECLKPQHLRGYSGGDLRALFLMVFGTILAVGYCQPAWGDAVDTQGPPQRMQSHLCQILAHYLLFLGSRLGLPIASGVDQFILKAAPSRWRKQGVFYWYPSWEDEDERSPQFPAEWSRVERELPEVSASKQWLAYNAKLPDLSPSNILASDSRLLQAYPYAGDQGASSSEFDSAVQDWLNHSIAWEQEISIPAAKPVQDATGSIPLCSSQNSWAYLTSCQPTMSESPAILSGQFDTPEKEICQLASNERVALGGSGTESEKIADNYLPLGELAFDYTDLLQLSGYDLSSWPHDYYKDGTGLVDDRTVIPTPYKLNVPPHLVCEFVSSADPKWTHREPRVKSTSDPLHSNSKLSYENNQYHCLVSHYAYETQSRQNLNRHLKTIHANIHDQEHSTDTILHFPDLITPGNSADNQQDWDSFYLTSNSGGKIGQSVTLGTLTSCSSATESFTRRRTTESGPEEGHLLV